jgi:MoxR-like ATPase
MPESRWMGKLIQNITTGEEHYLPSDFVQKYEHGGVFLADEADNSDASTILVLNSALANGHITLPNGRRIVKHKDFVFIVSANTFGHGQSREYVGRSQLDAAFLDRFVGSTVEMGYDKKLETALCPEAEIRDAVWGIRDKVQSLKLRRIVSTRAILAARKLMLGQGKTLKQALQGITVGWSDADRKAVGV